MLFEDFNSGVVPHRWEPDPYVLSGARMPNLASIDSYPHETGTRVDEFIRETTARLLVDHQVWLEVVLGDELGQGAPFSIFPVLGVKQSLNGNLVQEIPRREFLPDWVKSGTDWKNEIQLDNGMMIHIGLPTGYSSDMLLSIVNDLANLGSDMLPEWHTSQLFSQRLDPTPFDVAEFSRIRRLSVLQATQQIGWTAREVLRGQKGVINEYLLCLRELRFLHFKVAMRSQAEEGFRKAVEVAKQRTGYDCKVVTNGLYTTDEVEQLIRRFEQGEIAFSTVSEIIFERSEESSAETRRVV